MSVTTLRLVLTGHYAGQTVTLNGHTFTNGVLTTRGDLSKMEGLINYFGNAYQAYPEGSDELKAAQARDAGNTKEEPAHGGDENVAGQGDGADSARTDESAGTDQSDGTGDDGAATGDAGAGASETDPGAEGSVAGNSEPELPTDALSIKIRTALEGMDPTKDDQWTQAGLPRLDVLTEAVADATVDRDAVKSAWPGFNRERAAELHSSRDMSALDAIAGSGDAGDSEVIDI